MFKNKSWRLAGLAAALTLSACASTKAPGVTAADEPAYVASVEVVQQNAPANASFADALRAAVLEGATYYGSAGRPIALKISLDRVHFKNPLKAMVIGDDNRAKGDVAVIDQTSGQQLATFKVEVDAERPNAARAGASIGLTVLEAFDPTGASSLVDMAGRAASADILRGRTVAAMSTNFANETLRQTFGDAKTKAATLARREQAHAK